MPTYEKFRLNFSGTGIREMLRQGIIPPKEVIRPESAMAGMQGVQPKGVDADGTSVGAVHKFISSMFPWYRDRVRLGGHERTEGLSNEELTRRDREVAAARDLAAEIPAPSDVKRLAERTWNALEYRHYRGDDS